MFLIIQEGLRREMVNPELGSTLKLGILCMFFAGMSIVFAELFFYTQDQGAQSQSPQYVMKIIKMADRCDLKKIGIRGLLIKNIFISNIFLIKYLHHAITGLLKKLLSKFSDSARMFCVRPTVIQTKAGLAGNRSRVWR